MKLFNTNFGRELKNVCKDHGIQVIDEDKADLLIVPTSENVCNVTFKNVSLDGNGITGQFNGTHSDMREFPVGRAISALGHFIHRSEHEHYEVMPGNIESHVCLVECRKLKEFLEDLFAVAGRYRYFQVIEDGYDKFDLGQSMPISSPNHTTSVRTCDSIDEYDRDIDYDDESNKVIQYHSSNWYTLMKGISKGYGVRAVNSDPIELELFESGRICEMSMDIEFTIGKWIIAFRADNNDCSNFDTTMDEFISLELDGDDFETISCYDTNELNYMLNAARFFKEAKEESSKYTLSDLS